MLAIHAVEGGVVKVAPLKPISEILAAPAVARSALEVTLRTLLAAPVTGE